MTDVTYQINISPFDIETTQKLLEHQVNYFKEQVGEVLITYNVSEELLGDNSYKEKHERTLQVFNKVIDDKVKYVYVDYDKTTIDAVYDYYFKKIRKKRLYDCKGTPIYAFLYGFYKAKFDYVFHIDGDMFFGGKSKIWMKEAVDMLEGDDNILTVAPLPGPPHPDEILFGQKYTKVEGKPYHFYINHHVGTRVLLFNRKNLYKKLSYQLPNYKRIVYAIAFKKPIIDLLENIISKYVKKSGLKRVDFLGADGGTYTLHPLYRSQEFFDNIPKIIKDIEDNNIAEEQLGKYNMCSFIDWTEAREKFLKSKSLKRKLLGI